MFSFAWGWFNLFTPMYWRQLLFKRTRIAVYLTSGQVVKLTVGEFKINGASWSAADMRETNWINGGDKVVAFREIRWFR